MEFRAVGHSDLKASLLGLGCNNFGGRLDPAATARVVHRALDLGVTLFDTADIYGGEGRSESFLGEALLGRRSEVVIATKFGMPMTPAGKPRDASAAYVVQALEGSLRRLRTEWIDLYQVHRPDPATPIEETVRALDQLVRQGKVRFIGCSNFTAAEAAGGAGGGPAIGSGRVRVLPGPIQPARPRRRADAAARSPCAWARVHPVFPPGERIVDGGSMRVRTRPGASCRASGMRTAS